MPIKQARDCRVGDIILYKNEESRMITDIDHRGRTYLIRTTGLAEENRRFDTYDALDEVKVWGTQEALF
jgi:hypothetical protein|nr:MAG TPA: hypothetical protein [Caudoviricetes sp.]